MTRSSYMHFSAFLLFFTFTHQSVVTRRTLRDFRVCHSCYDAVRLPIHNNDQQDASAFTLALLGHEGSIAFPSQWWQGHVAQHHAARDDAEKWSWILNDAMIDALVNSFNADPTLGADQQQLRVVRRYQRVEDGTWWTAQAPLDSHSSNVNLAQLIRRLVTRLHGFSLVLNQVHRQLPTLSSICEAIMDDIVSYRCTANVYVTPSQSQAFEAHMDWMHSIVIQIRGAKSWALYGTIIDAPFASMKRRPHSHETIPPIVRRDLIMNAGDVLYIPAGLVHEANTVNTDNASIHVTIGIEIDSNYTWIGLISRIITDLRPTFDSTLLHSLFNVTITQGQRAKALRKAFPIRGQDRAVVEYVYEAYEFLQYLYENSKTNGLNNAARTCTNAFPQLNPTHILAARQALVEELQKSRSKWIEHQRQGVGEFMKMLQLERDNNDHDEL